MRKLGVFNQVSLDGYFCDAEGQMGWAHRQDAEWGQFVSENARGGGELVFGRITYQMMAGFWPTAAGRESNPTLARRMTALPKVVFSRTLAKAAWKNTRLLSGDLKAAVRKLKKEPGPDLVIMGSGTIVAQLTQLGLIDEYQVVLNPIVLGAGRTMFEGVTRPVDLKLQRTRTFANGNVVLWYEA